MYKATVSRNEKGAVITVRQAQEMFNLSRNLLMETAKNANAVYRIGRAIRIDRERLLNHLRQNGDCR